MKYYIDESGNTGDIGFTKNRLDFGGQPVFSLACIGIKDLSALEEKVTALKATHKIRSDELKTTSLYKEKPKFIRDIFKYIKSEELPFFIEIVDKKYQLAVTIVNHYILQSYFMIEEDEESIAMRNIFSDFIYHYVDDRIFFDFISIFDNPSETKIVGFFNVLLNYFEKMEDEISRCILELVRESLDDYKHIKIQEGDNAYKRFLPLPDINKRGEKIWILPNYASFTHIYARINLYTDGNLSDIDIMHDEQVHFDEIIKDAKISAESATNINKAMAPNADFSFVDYANLTFGNSKENLGIQIADILAGFSSRFLYDYYSNNRIFHLPLFLQPPSNRHICEYKAEAINILFESSIPEKGVGINFVSSKEALNLTFNRVQA